MNSYIQSFISANENLSFSLENIYKRFNYLSFVPVQANFSNSIDDKGKKVSWFQLVCNYKSHYDAIDENGIVCEDENATIKTLYVKFSGSYLEKFGLSVSVVKDFFNENFIKKGAFLTLPVTDEMPNFDYSNGSKVIIKNSSQVSVYSDFNLLEFIKSFSKDTSKK